MRIAIIHQYYKTPQTGGAIRSYYIAKYLKEQGHDVVVVTARNNRAYSIDTSDGYEVHNLPVYYSNHLSFLSRIHAFFLFVWSANRLIKKIQPFDLNYVITTPLSTGFIALKAKRKFGTPYIFEVGDLWPEAPIQLGVIKNIHLKKIAYYFERKFYNEAKSIVALSPDIRDNILAKMPEKQIDIITNFSDVDFFNKEQKITELELKYNVQNKFVISYIGTVGLANHMEYLIEVAKACVSNNQLQFIIVGSGARYGAIESLAKHHHLDNITFLPHMDKDGIKEIMNITDAIFISFKNVPILSAGSPNKFFDGLAAGKILIINFEGWIKDLIEKNNCGFYYNPLDPKSLQRHLETLIVNEEVINEQKENARKVALKFSTHEQLKTLKTLMDE